MGPLLEQSHNALDNHLNPVSRATSKWGIATLENWGTALLSQNPLTPIIVDIDCLIIFLTAFDRPFTA